MMYAEVKKSLLCFVLCAATATFASENNQGNEANRLFDSSVADVSVDHNGQ
jgi:hypothetical protein